MYSSSASKLLQEDLLLTLQGISGSLMENKSAILFLSATPFSG